MDRQTFVIKCLYKGFLLLRNVGKHRKVVVVLISVGPLTSLGHADPLDQLSDIRLLFLARFRCLLFLQVVFCTLVGLHLIQSHQGYIGPRVR